ncbi:alkaline phosphatase family protein [Natrialbaceae archaeon A-gly3]
MEKVKQGINDPSAVLKYMRQIAREKFVTQPGRKYLYNRYGGPVNVFEEDWDNLIILDACRYDTFADLNTLPGKLDRRLSIASATMEWVQKTIGDREFYDTVYITANPRVNRYEGQFHKIIPAWEDHWDDELKVVLPDTLANLTIKAHKEFPEKRIVAHFMQPHIPFIGDFGKSEIGVYDGTTKGRDRALGNNYDSNTEPYVLLEKGKIDENVIKKAYRENLQTSLVEVERLLNTLEGKSIVTADHGEMFGEIGWPSPFRIYGHKNRSPAKPLLEVPWLKHTNGERRKVTSEQVSSSEENLDEEVIENRLKHLGYK